jgi:sugar phosphate isomerase/epimerase
MKLAASTLGCPDWTLAEICERFPAYGYTGVELRGLGPALNLTEVPAFAPIAIADTRQAFADAGLRVCSVDTSASFADPDRQAGSVLETHAAVSLAQSLGSPFVRIFPGTLPGHESREAELAAMADRLRTVGTYAADNSDVVLILETHDSFSTGAGVAEVLALTDHPRVAALWDLHHPYRHGETPAQTFAALAPFVRHVHVKDSRPPDGYCLLGEGDVPVFAMLQLLQDAGYDGWLSLEWEKRWQPDLLDPTIAFPQYAAKLQDYHGQLSR